MFRSLSIFNYRAWFFGALISNIGAWMQATALSWIVLTVLTDNDAGAVGINMALQFGPQLLLVPISGLVADKFDRRKILLVTQSTMSLLAVALAAITVTGVVQLWMVQLFALAFGVTQAMDAPARQAFVSQLVGRRLLPNAVALNSASFHGARLIGPAVAGLSIAVVGPGWVFALNALTFLAMIIALLAMRRDDLEPSPRGAKGFRDIAQGVKYVGRRDDILIVMVMAVLLGTFGLNFPIFISTMTIEFGHDAESFGLLSSSMAIGSVTGALLAARAEYPRYSLIIGGLGLFALGAAGAAWAPNIWFFGITLAALGLFGQLFMTNANSQIQLSTAPEMRGRVMALYSAVFLGGTPIGAPIVGFVANALGPRWGIMVAVVAAAIAFGIGVIWWMRARKAERLTRTGTLSVPPVTQTLDTRN
ncbi:MFS transporter [uncultured Agrococcus sp.]|uniref:MFS transporter n=1 Tax=uncultured Agrococcus sp. TaxID=382258 RepID=UPI0025F92896|nr:MFS transporter [uncultured Agrococcus sp.]